MFAALEFIIKNYIEAIIAILTGIICVIGGYVIYKSAFIKPDDADESEAAFKKIEESIEKLLKAHPSGAISTGGAARGTLVDSDGNPVENAEELFVELELKKKEIEDLKKNTSADNSAELLSKIRSLEDRLAEYEIIEDDIADLSKFKEENARLKRQLEQATSGAAPKAAAAEEKVFSLEDGSAEEEASAFEEAAQEMGDDPGIAEAVEALGAETVEDMGQAAVEFEAAADAAGTDNDSDPIPAPTDDVLGEFSEEAGEAEDPLAALGDIDTNKMLEEIQDLSSEAEASAEVLEKATDVDKLAQEAKAKE